MEKIKSIIEASIQVKQMILADEVLLQTIRESTEMIVTSLKNGSRLYFCGNGGSAADAQHLAAEFSGRFYKDRLALPAEALHVNTSYLTSVGNDYGFDMIYSRLVEGIMHKGDILIGMSTSGNSANIVKAFEAARSKDIVTIGLTGLTGGILKSLSDFLINVPSADTPRIQESHIMIGHIICELAEEQYFAETEN